MSNDTREKIIQSAGELIYASSYSDVGVQSICNHADVKKGSFYHFFSSKNDLVIAVIDAHSEVFKSTIVAPAFSKNIPPLERFTRMLEIIHQQNRQTKNECSHVLGCPFGNLAVEMSTQNEALRIKLESIFLLFKELFKETLQEASSKGTISNINIDASADALIAYFQGIMLLSKTRNDPDLIKQLMPDITRLLISSKN